MTENLYRSFESFVLEQEMIKEKDRLIAGISGGADSVCLLFLLCQFRKTHEIRLAAVHVNHMIRGEDADRDEAFVRQLCRDWDVPLLTEKTNVPELSRRLHLSEEEAGRKARYDIFLKLAKEQDAKVVVAHHVNDNAETVLLNLIRGTGIRGLSGMKPVSEKEGCRILRPLLLFERKEIEEFLKQQDISFCTDTTNTDPVYARNRIRQKVFPAFSAINPRAANHIAKTSEMLGEIDAYLEKEASSRYDRIVTSNENETMVDITALQKTETVFIGRIVLRAIAETAGKSKDITSGHVEAVLALTALQSGRQVSLPYGLSAVRQYDRIVIRKNDVFSERTEDYPEIRIEKETLLGEEKHVTLPDGRKASFRVIPVTDENRNDLKKKNTYTKAFDYDRIKNVIKVGRKVPGDRIILNGGAKTVKKLFIDEKIPQDKRSRLLLFKDEEQVIWVEGIRISEHHKITNDTKKALMICITGGENGCRY